MSRSSRGLEARRIGLARTLKARLLAGVVGLLATIGLQALPGAQPVDYEVGSGDELGITVFGHEDLSGEYLVDGTGEISFPLIGEVVVGGKTLRQIEESIVSRLKPDYLKNPSVSIQVLNFRPFYIIGEVNNPGSYPYVDGMKLINAVALAGGFTHRAKEDELLIIRGNDPERKKRPASQDTVVLPGDVIEVPERFF